MSVFDTVNITNRQKFLTWLRQRFGEFQLELDPVALAGEGVNFVVANASADNAATNGVNLLAAYTAAKALTPNGSALSATNRATLIIPPGVYSLPSVWEVDGEFVDAVALKSTQKSPMVLLTTNSLNVTANDVRVLGISVGVQPFTTATNKPLQVFEDSTGGQGSFGGSGDIFSGVATNCTGGTEAFGGEGGTFSGTAINCVGAGGSFGGAGGTFSGVATNCVGGAASYGKSGTLSGKLYYCRLTSGTFETVSGAGQTRFCLTGTNVADNQG